MKNKLDKIIKSKVFKNSIWLTVLQFVNTIIPTFTIPYITRILGTEQYGIFSKALNWIIYFQVLVEFGFGLTGARKTAIIREKENLQELFNNIISARILLLVFSFILMNIISFFSNFDIITYVCMNLLFIMIISTTFQLTWLFQGKQDMKFITIINTISRIISICLIFIFVKTKNDVLLYSFLYSVTLFISSFISMVVAYKKYKLKFTFSKLNDIKKEIIEGKYLFYSSAISKVFSGIGITILGFFSTNSMVGIYSALTKIPFVLNVAFSPISQALFPFCSLKFKESKKIGIKTVKKIFLYVFCVYFIISFILILLNEGIVNILFGKEYLTYSKALLPLVIQFLFAIINNFIGVQILVASGNQKRYSKAFSLSCVAMIILNIFLGKFFGIYGVSMASLCGEFILTLLLIYQFKCFKEGVIND